MPKDKLAVIDADAMPVEHEPEAIALGTLRASTPDALLLAAKAISTPLVQLIEDAKLVKRLGGRNYVMAEGWTALAAMLGVLPIEESVQALEDGGYIATVALKRMNDGAVISRASASCGMDELKWKKSPAYARRSMAITRATAKVCRIAFSWVMVAAGYSATPAEEVPEEGFQDEHEPEAPKPRNGKRSHSGALPTTQMVGKTPDKPLVETSEKHLKKIREWVTQKQEERGEPQFFADLVRAIDLELVRRESEVDEDVAHEDEVMGDE